MNTGDKTNSSAVGGIAARLFIRRKNKFYSIVFATFCGNSDLSFALLLVLLGTVLQAAPADALMGVTVTNHTMIEQWRHPTDWLTLGAEFRLRHEYYNNAATVDSQAANHEFSYERYRAKWWAGIQPWQPLTLNARLATENRWYWKPNSLRGARLDDFFLDNLNLTWTNAAPNPISLILGRQDIKFGNLWLFNDGTTRDGSRSDFFDAARLIYDVRDLRTTLNLVYFDQSANPTRGLPAINNQHKLLNDSDARGLYLYAINRSLPKMQLDGYFVYKHDRAMSLAGNNGNLYLLGARFESALGGHWKPRFEFAPEFGDRNGRSVQAFGFNSRLGYEFNDARQNNFHLAYEYLSGDTPGAGHDEGFDPLWGRRAQFSELLVFTFGAETGHSAEWTNLQRLGAGWSFKPARRLEFQADYHALWANENTFRGRAGYSDTGRFRGHLASGVLRYNFNDYISAYLWTEAFWPGNYYAEPKGDMATHLRAQVLFKF